MIQNIVEDVLTLLSLVFSQRMDWIMKLTKFNVALFQQRRNDIIKTIDLERKGEKMDTKLQALIDYFTEHFGLEHYQLERYSFYKESLYNGEFQYQCTMELFPNATKDEAEEDLNPPGTAVIEYNLTTQKLVSVLFVNGQSFSTKTFFKEQTVRDIASWVEEQTGYHYDKDFFVTDTLDNGYEFKTDFHGISSSPSGTIEVEFDEEGKLTSFSTFNMQTIQEEVEQENFTLSLADIAETVKKQVQLIRFPDEVEQRFIPLYAINETFITNDGKELITYEVEKRDEVIINQVVEWTEALEGTIERKIVAPYIEVSLEEAFAQGGKTVKPAIENEQIPIILQKVRDVLRTVNPDDSGKWMVATIRRTDTFIEVICTLNEAQRAFLNRKFILLLDPITLDTLNYIDNKELMDILFSFTPAPKEKVSQEEAYQKLYSSITLTPTYVYNPSKKKFQLCGLLDSQYCVDAITGNLLPLDEV